MKDIDLGKEYVIPSPGYRNIRERNSLNQRGRQDGIKFRQEKYKVDCQDALETAARAEGLPLESSADSHLRALDEEHPKGKYHYGLNLMKPIRTTSKHRHPIDNAGLFSYMTFSWLSPLARLAYKKGELLTQDMWPLSTHESSEVNCRRLERLWHQEVHDYGQGDASLRRVVWNFCRTRLIISIACLMITQLAGFSGPSPVDALKAKQRVSGQLNCHLRLAQHQPIRNTGQEGTSSRQFVLNWDICNYLYASSILQEFL